MQSISEYWQKFQAVPFPRIEAALEEPLTEKLQQLIRIFDVIRVESFIQGPYSHLMGRRPIDRRAIARAFIAKAFFDVPTTECLIEMLRQQSNLRKLCGFEHQNDIPSASTFSRAFADLAENKLGDRIHEALVKQNVGEKVVMHVSRDATEVCAREKPARADKTKSDTKRKRGRPQKGEIRPEPEPTRMEKQLTQTAEAALAELPRSCGVGSKKDSKGNLHRWIGYKVHIDWADGAIPLTAITTSASLHDSQAAIPLERLTAGRCVSLYCLMDAAYDAGPIRKVAEEHGHVAIIDQNPRHGDKVPMERYRAERFKERTTAERGNSSLKDEFGFRHLRVRGHAKAHMHLMFGVLVLFANQLHKVFGT